MDRLLQVLFGAFIRRGTFKLTTSRGKTYTFGDGTGAPVAVRLSSRRAELALLLDPELKFGEAYMDGTLVVEQGTIADVLAVLLGQGMEAPEMGPTTVAVALHQSSPRPVQSAPASPPQRRASLRSRRPSLLTLPRCRPAVQLRLFRKPGHLARRRTARQETASRCEADA